MTKLNLFTNNFQYLEDDQEYIDALNIEKPEEYLIIYSNLSPIIEIATELITNNISFSHHEDPIAGQESYLLIHRDEVLNHLPNFNLLTPNHL